MKIYHCFCVVLIATLFTNAASELVTVSLVGSAVVAGASGWYNWATLKNNLYCPFSECCNDDHIPYDMNKLRLSLSQKIFGQPLVKELVNVLTAHKDAMIEKRNKKALVLSFHGWSGVGKNYVTTMIADALFVQGINSRFVKMYMGKKDFGCANLEQKKEDLVATINQLVKKCPKSLIIFDEIHEMCASVLDAIKPMLDHHHAVDGVDYRDSVFIFISNTGGPEITKTLLELTDNGLKRNDVEFRDFEPSIRKAAYFQGGFEKSTVIAHHLIDHYVPFLPLEQIHIEQCALAEFRANGVYQPSKEMMMDALSVIVYGPTEDKAIFSNNGCKRLNKRVPFIKEKYKKMSTNEL